MRVLRWWPLPRERPALAGVYKIAGEMPGKFLRQNGLRGGSVYDLTHDRGEAVKAEQGEQAQLEGISAGQAADGRVVMLTLAARVDDQGFADAAEFFQHGVDAERLALARQFALQQRGQQQRQDTVEGMHLDLGVGPMQ